MWYRGQQSLSQDVCFIILGTELQNPDSTSRKDKGVESQQLAALQDQIQRAALPTLTPFTEQPELGDQGKWRYIYMKTPSCQSNVGYYHKQ